MRDTSRSFSAHTITAFASWGRHPHPVHRYVQGPADIRLLYAREGGQIREAVNDWIRANKTADGLIDFDKLLEDPNNPKHINPAYDCGDHLHPNDAGYQAMAKAVDLTVLLPKQ